MSTTSCSALIKNLMGGNKTNNSSQVNNQSNSGSNTNSGSQNGSNSQPSSTMPSSTPNEFATMEDIANDINAAFQEDGYDLALEWLNDYDEYYLEVSFGSSTDESQANLKSATDILEGYLPAYLSEEIRVYGDPTDPEYYDLFEDNSIYYYVGFMTASKQVEVAVCSYIYDSELIGQIEIYEAED